MESESQPISQPSFSTVTPVTWGDMQTLFDADSICKGCYCMWFRVKRSEWMRLYKEGTRTAMKAIIDSGEVPGLLAYLDGKPVGWVSVGPRQNFGVLSRSRILKPVDDQPVWSVVCFFVAKPYRSQGITVALLKEALRYAASQGARIVEGYPVDTHGEKIPPPWAYYGLLPAFQQAGFVEVLRRSQKRPIMRCYL